MENTFIIYLYQIASFCVIIYSNTNSLQLFCEIIFRQIFQSG